MTYDLRRLRLHGLIDRVAGTNTYVLKPDGLRTAVFYTKVQGRVLRPVPDHPPTPLELRRAIAVIDRTVADYVPNGGLGAAA